MTAAGSGIGRSTVIDGLTITGGGGASGAGITIGGGASPTLRNLVIHGNNAANAGGGVSDAHALATRDGTCRLWAGDDGEALAG